MSTAPEIIRQHWDARSRLGGEAGTQDVILKELEQRVILQELRAMRPHSVLEIGCGNGELARLMAAKEPQADILAVDGARGMIAAAKAERYPTSRLRFMRADVSHLPDGRFDVIVTERLLINLPSWEQQLDAFVAIAQRLVTGGVYVSCESSQDGLDAINETRARVGLIRITPERPWNRYLRDDELARVDVLRLERCRPFSAVYYYNSRLCNAYHAVAMGITPQYEAPVNQMAIKQAEDDVNPKYAQARLWIWRKP